MTPEQPPPDLVPPTLEIYLLGLTDVEDVLSLQQRLIYDVGGEDNIAALVLCEHLGAITVGRQGSRAHILCDDTELAHRGLTVRWTNRGGGSMLHVPGQLNASLVFPLRSQGLGIQAYVDRLHAAVIDLLGEYSLTGTTRPGMTGVWIEDRLVATLGIAVNRWIAYHGISLNVCPPIKPFRLIQPMPGGRMTSMAAQRHRPTDMTAVRESMIYHLERQFGIVRHHLYFDHPLIHRKRRAHVYAGSPA